MSLNIVLFFIVYVVMIVFGVIILLLVDKYIDDLWGLKWKIIDKFKRPEEKAEKEKGKVVEKTKEEYCANIKGAKVKLEFLKEDEKFAVILLSLKAYQLSGRRIAIAEKNIASLDEIFEEKLDIGYTAVKEEFLDKILGVVGKDMLYRLKDSSIAIRTLYLLETEYTQEFPSSPVWIEEEFKTKQFRKAFADAKIEFQEEREKDIKEPILESESEKDKVLEALEEIKNKIGKVDEMYEKLDKISEVVQEMCREMKETNEKNKELETKKSEDFKTAQDFKNELKEIELGERDELSAKLIGVIKRILANPRVKSETKQVLSDMINKALNNPKLKPKVQKI